MLVKIPGVGKKTADRLIIEMRDRILDTGSSSPLATGRTEVSDARGEAFDALVALGYKPTEVKRLISNVETNDLTAEDIIRGALKQAVH